MKFGYLVFVLLGTLIFFSCKKETDACQDYYMGPFELLDSSADAFPYSESQTKVIFSDSLGKEVEGSFSIIYTGYGLTIGDSIPCTQDPATRITVRANYGSRAAVIVIPDLDLRFSITYGAIPDLMAYESPRIADLANVTASRLSKVDSNFINPVPQILIVLNERTRPGEFPNQAFPVPVFSIQGKIFNNVFSNTTGADVIDIHYNFAQGLIGFKEKSTGKSYKLE